MFIHQTQPINVPQYEHDKLAGNLALHWGNKEFDRPGVDFQAFVAGVALHDWSYGVLDDVPILEAPEDEWLAVMRKGVAYRFDDPVVDIIGQLHIRRLLMGEQSRDREALVGRIDGLVAERLPETGLTLEQFRWIDRITRFCDTISFDFCFGYTDIRRLPLCPRWDVGDTIMVGYEIEPPGTITVAPWPFVVPSFSGILIGYERQGYPDRLDPQLLPYRVVPA